MRYVLNAFRHQRGSHPGRCCRMIDTSSLRAQRLSASKRVALAARRCGHCSAWLCSTPFGIKEGRTGCYRGDLAGMAGCSTPFGIKEGRTSTIVACRSPWSVSAQRLSASKRVALSVRCCRRRRRLVRAQRLSASKRVALAPNPESPAQSKCSTPFGIKEGRTERQHSEKPRFIECSTPFGIKEGRTVSV